MYIMDLVMDTLGSLRAGWYGSMLWGEKQVLRDNKRPDPDPTSSRL